MDEARQRLERCARENEKSLDLSMGAADDESGRTSGTSVAREYEAIEALAAARAARRWLVSTTQWAHSLLHERHVGGS